MTRISQQLTALPVVERNQKIWGGKTIIRGTRIPVFIVRSLYDSGESPSEIVERYPGVSLEKVLGALYYSERHRDLIGAERRDYENAAERLRPR